MNLQPSASKTGVFLLCQRPFDPGTQAEPDEPGEPALYGSAFHQIIGACLRTGWRGTKKAPLESTAEYARTVDRAAKRYDMKDARAELAGHVKGSVKVLRNWLVREKLEVSEIERAYGIRPTADGTWKARLIKPHNENHVYDVAPDEMPGTVDLIATNENRKRTVVMDHKTGLFEDWFGNDDSVKFARPTTVAQLRTLGLVGSALHGEVSIFHADRRGLPMVYSEPYEVSEQQQHAKELHGAFSRVGKGFLRPGEYCKRCPARAGCPASAAHLLVESAAVLVEAANKVSLEPIDPNAFCVLPVDPPPAGMIEARAGALYDMLKRFRELEKAAVTELKRLVRAGAVIETREGKVLAIQTQTYETLSKKSVIEALGKVAGEKELARLRKKGAIREATREMLVGEK
jgi:hypothetical protein